MLLFLASRASAAAAFLVGEVATYPPARRSARSSARADVRAACAIRADELERLRFRERVLAAGRGAARLDPAEAQPAHERRVGAAKLHRRRAVAAPHARSSSRSRAARIVGGLLLGLRRCRALRLGRGAIFLVPMFGARRVPRPGLVPDDAHRERAARRSAASCPTRSTCSPSASRPGSASTARSRS